MKKHFYIFFIFFFLFVSLFLLGFNIFQIDKLDKIAITGYFINPNQYLSFFNQQNSQSANKTYDLSEIEKKIEENQQTIANLILNGISFIHKRSMRSKGFETSTEFKKEFIKFNLEPYSISSENGYYFSKTSLITITDYIRKKVKRITEVNGILMQADASLSFFDKIASLNTITEDVLFEAVKNCIINSVIKAYGNNYIFEINGYFNLVELPEYRFSGSIIYVRIKGYVIFYSFVR